MDNYHVTHTGKQWALKKEGAQRASKTAETKSEITQQTRQFMETHEGSVKFHKMDGTIQEERTYPRSKDPSKSKG